MSHDSVRLFAYASDIAGASPGSSAGPLVLKKSSFLSQLNVDMDWQAVLEPDHASPSKTIIVEQLCQKLSLLTEASVIANKFFIVIGGDHTSAIGTWSGAAYANKDKDMGLIWVDAHLDSHTPLTSPSGNLHGMPLACLLGYGDAELINLHGPSPKLKPENICLIGIRSYEPGELQLLQNLNVRIYFMDEVKQRGLKTVMQEAIERVNRHTSCYGISIDVDSIDPHDAPGTGVAEHDGIRGDELCEALALLATDKRLIGAEIVEFDPARDINHLTEKLIVQMLSAITKG